MRLAFDLDETLGVPLIVGNSIAGFRLRDGCAQLLGTLKLDHTLLLWTVSNRSYVEKVLSYGLAEYFAEIYSWDEVASRWKDVRQTRADYLIDDSPHHREKAEAHGLAQHYIVVAGYGSVEDQQDPLLWVRQIEQGLVGR